MRIAMLTYSVKPRGGVVHAVEVAEALQRRGHEVELMALGRPGDAFFRDTPVPTRIVRHTPADGPFDRRIEGMIEAYADGLKPLLGGGSFDIVHAQDCLSANAALILRDEGAIEHVIRTVHHVDDFTSPSLVECQDRSIVSPDHVLCVSPPWVRRLRDEFGVSAGLVRNGVDTHRFRPPRDAAERAAARRAAGVEDRLTVLTVGGVEPRKGSLTLLDGFARLRETLAYRDPLLLIAGGVTLFDYRHEIDRFEERLRELGLTRHVRRLGPLEPDEIEQLFRAADVFAFPSVKEGFGLAALEALAAGLPLVASDIEVFRGFLTHGRSALLHPVGDAEALAAAMTRVARDPNLRARLRDGGDEVVAQFGWDRSGAEHEAAYEAVGSVAR
ncbi:MSMEG_0565 family glycosyltransferase [Solirubrobacter soli]|uniref:MSMEG_0565 family glycosyltransferase n=1 Tax=Solirubrobacter soli TaxID=363832 RepID=UPI0003FB7366|nr:MSMEG_0565 family glycosyltransferase [Solirubrobacter soli]